jgi:hypothetical protein
MSYRLLRIGVHFIKHDTQWCIFKMCANFTNEVVGQRRKLKAIKKKIAQKINVILFFDIYFLNIFSEFYMKPVARD